MSALVRGAPIRPMLAEIRSGWHLVGVVGNAVLAGWHLMSGVWFAVAWEDMVQLLGLVSGEQAFWGMVFFQISALGLGLAGLGLALCSRVGGRQDLAACALAFVALIGCSALSSVCWRWMFLAHL